MSPFWWQSRKRHHRNVFRILPLNEQVQASHVSFLPFRSNIVCQLFELGHFLFNQFQKSVAFEGFEFKLLFQPKSWVCELLSLVYIDCSFSFLRLELHVGQFYLKKWSRIWLFRRGVRTSRQTEPFLTLSTPWRKS